MIPSYFIQLNEFPLTSNGKVDRKALPEPEGEIATGRVYLPPTNDIEEKLVTIWSEILGIGKIGICDDFLEIGGHSLNAMHLASRISKEYNVELSIGDIFKLPTIKEFAEYIFKADKKNNYKIEQIEVKEYYSISSASTKNVYS